MAKPFCDEISKYFQSILVNISRIKELKKHPKFLVKSTMVFRMPFLQLQK